MHNLLSVELSALFKWETKELFHENGDNRMLFNNNIQV
jgi:hypothetical protein